MGYSKTQRMTFDQKQLRPIRQLVAEGVVIHSWRTVRDLCRQKKFPAVKVGREWMSTENLCRSFYYKGANPAARRLAA
jgi:hypothetical protein